MNLLSIIGAGGHGKVVADVATAMGYTKVSFFDQQYPTRRMNGVWPVCGTPAEVPPGDKFCGIGSNSIRAQMFETYDLNAAPILIHPFTSISPSAHVNAGSLLVAGVVVNACAYIGLGVILNTGCSVDHDCVVENFVHISPGARLAGNVRVGERSWIGIGAVVREGVTIGSDVVVASGAAVSEDVRDNTIVGGVPARLLKHRK